MLTKLKNAPKWQWIAAILAVIVLVSIPLSGDRRLMNIAIMSLMYIALGESWNLLSGMAGIFSIAHSIFFGLGVYGVTITLSRLSGNFFFGVLLGLALCMVMAFIVGLIGSKLSGLYFTMALIGLSQTVYTLALQLFPITGGAMGISMPREYYLPKEVIYLLAILLAAGSMIMFVAVRRSRWGTNLVALKENPNLANALGSNVAGWRIFATMLSAGMASICGAFYSLHMMSNNPEVFSGTISLKIIMVVIVGGIGNVWGPVLGSVMVILDEFVRGAMPSNQAPLSVVIYALVLIIMAMLRPEGLISIFRKRSKKQRLENEAEEKEKNPVIDAITIRKS